MSRPTFLSSFMVLFLAFLLAVPLTQALSVTAPKTTSTATGPSVPSATSTTITTTTTAATTTEDNLTNGGFKVEDLCGYIQGTSTPSGKIKKLSAEDSSMSTSEYPCLDENGYAYKDSSQESYLYNKTLGNIDLAWDIDGADSRDDLRVDTVTGKWTGYGLILTTLTGSGSQNQWLWFDWVCRGSSSEAEKSVTCTDLTYEQYRPKTDTTTGEVTGYAWSDYLYTTTGNGYVSLNGLTMELPPHQIQAFVTIEDATGNSPVSATVSNAPLADGYDYWRVGVEFYDTTDARYLSSSEVTLSDFDLEEDSTYPMYIDQVFNTGTAILEGGANPTLTECKGATAECVMAESDGAGATWESWNLFVVSASPTSNMIGMNDDGDSTIDYPTDRAGCATIYISSFPCPVEGTLTKDEVFQLRKSDRNMYILNRILLDPSFSLSGSRDAELLTGSQLVEDGSGAYAYTFGTGEGTLSFRPRYQIKEFLASYDGGSYTSLSSEIDKPMSLEVTATVSGLSDARKKVFKAVSKTYTVYTQSDSRLSDTSTPDIGDPHFILDANDDSTPEAKTKTEASTTLSYTDSVVLGYLCPASKTAAGVYGFYGDCSAATTVPASPTLEQWVCDAVPQSRTEFSSQPSCYYTAYLPLTDRHAPPQDMGLVGSISATVDQSGLFSASDEVSVQGSFSAITLRNRLYAALVRSALGVSVGHSYASADENHLDGEMNPEGDIKELMGGRLLLAEEDVHIDGVSSGGSFTDKTLVVLGGDVYIDGSIEGGHLGIIVFTKEGVGGNVYLGPEATELYANLFLDGSLFNYTDGVDISAGPPAWANEQDRYEATQNQLYLKGSLVSRNNIGSGDEYDLNRLRQYRLCYPIDPSTGELDTSTTEECGAGEKLSSYLDSTGAPVYSSLILEYSPADLPIFVVGAR